MKNQSSLPRDTQKNRKTEKASYNLSRQTLLTNLR